jgi:hypothetical protein
VEPGCLRKQYAGDDGSSSLTVALVSLKFEQVRRICYILYIQKGASYSLVRSSADIQAKNLVLFLDEVNFEILFWISRNDFERVV